MVFDGENFECVRQHPNEQPLSGLLNGVVSVHSWMFGEQFTQQDPRKLEVLFAQYARQRRANHLLAGQSPRSL